ncbi:MAG: hypothetical protein AAF512_21375 [Pseudomonadota bacterium]
MVEEKLNLNGEFLGISTLAVYSAPWFLHLPLLFLVAILFFSKISGYSKELEQMTKAVDENSEDDLEALLGYMNYTFFGFAVPRKNLTAYWMGFMIFLVSLLYMSYNTYWQVFEG